MTRRHLILTGAGCLAAGLAAGWYLRASPDSTTQEMATERVEARTVEAFAGSEEWVTRRDLATDTHQVRTEDHGGVTRYHPSGAVAEVVAPSRIVTETGTQARETAEGQGTTTVQAAKSETVYVDRWHTRTVTTPAPDWLLSAQVAAGSAGVMYGGQASRRILGPLHLSAGLMAGGGEWLAVGGAGVAF